MTDRERGATVTEVLVVLAVSGIVTVALVLSLFRGIRTSSSIDADLVQDRRAARIVEVLDGDLRQSQLDGTALGTIDPSTSIALTHTDENGISQTLNWSIDRGQLARQTRDPRTGRSTVALFGPASALAVRYSTADNRPVTLSGPADADCVRLIAVELELVADDEPVSVTVAPRIQGSGQSC